MPGEFRYDMLGIQKTAVFGVGFSGLVYSHSHKASSIPDDGCLCSKLEISHLWALLSLVTLGREKDPSYKNIWNPIPQKKV